MATRPGNRKNPNAAMNMGISAKVSETGAIKTTASLGRLASTIDVLLQSSQQTRLQSLQLGKTLLVESDQAHRLTTRYLEMDIVLGRQQSQLEKIIQSKKSLSDFSNKEIKDLETIWRKYSRLTEDIKRAREAGDEIFTKEQEQFWLDAGETLARVIDKHEKLQKVTKILGGVTNEYGRIFKGVFGALVPQDIGKASEVIGAFRETFQSHVNIANKTMGTLGLDSPTEAIKKKGANWILSKLGLNNPEEVSAAAKAATGKLSELVGNTLGKKEGAAVKAMRAKAEKNKNPLEQATKSTTVSPFAKNLKSATLSLKQVGDAQDNTANSTKDLQKAAEKMSTSTKGLAENLEATQEAAGDERSGAAGAIGKMAIKAGLLATIARAGGPPGWAIVAVIIAIKTAAMLAYFQIKMLTEGMKDAIEYEEEFRTTGFRAAGSIHELVNASMDLSMQTGLNSKEMIKLNRTMLEAGITASTLSGGVVDANGSIVTGTKALNALSIGVAKYTTATGASIKTAAVFTKHMMRMGANIGQNEQVLGQFTMAARKFGLTGGDLDLVMGQLNKDMFTLQKTFHMGPADIANYARELGALSGIAKHLGANMSVVTEIMRDISGLTKRAMTLAAFGGGMDKMFKGTAVEKMRAMAAGAEDLTAMLNSMDDVARAHTLRQLGMTEEYLAVLVKRGQMTDEELKKLAKMENATKALDNSFKESTKTMKKLFERVLTPILALFTKLASPIIKMIEGAMASLQEGGGALGEFGGLFENFGGLIKDIFGMFETFYRAFKPVFTFLWSVLVLFGDVINFIIGGVRLLIKLIDVVIVVAGVLMSPIIGAFNIVAGIVFAIGDFISYMGTFLGNLFDFTGGVDAWAGRMVSAWKAFTSSISDSADLIMSPFEYLADMLQWIYDILFVGNSPSLIEIVEMFFSPFASMGDIAGDAINFMKDAFMALYEPVALVGKAIGDFLVEPFEYIVGLFDRALARIKGFAKDAYGFLKEIPIVGRIVGLGEATMGKGEKATTIDKVETGVARAALLGATGAGLGAAVAGPIGLLIGGLGGAIAGAVSSFGEGGEIPYDGLINAHEGEQVINRDLSAQLENFLNQKPEDYFPTYTVQFTDSAKSDKTNKLDEVTDQLRELNMLMAKLVDKEDPDTTRTADALERIAEDASEASNELDSVRSRSGLGEQAVQWGFNR